MSLKFATEFAAVAKSAADVADVAMMVAYCCRKFRRARQSFVQETVKPARQCL